MEQPRRITKTYKVEQPFISESGHECNAFNISISYTKSGVSFWDYNRYPSGYRVSYTPLIVSKDRDCGFVMYSYAAGDGFYTQEEVAERFSAKKLHELAEKVFDNIKEWLDQHNLASLNEIGYHET